MSTTKPAIITHDVQEWPTITVRYWDHVGDGPGRINDCFGNSFTAEIKARTTEEARRKFYVWHQKNRKGTAFPRIHSIG